MEPAIIPGGCHTDARGTVLYNNSFDASIIKRVYVIQNARTDFVRAWQGHRMEQRWFSAVQGRFKIWLVAMDDWEHPSKNLLQLPFVLDSERMDILHVPPGYISSIQALTEAARLLVMADYLSGEVKDEYRFDAGYFFT